MPDRNLATSPASILVERRIEWWDTDASSAFHNTAAFRLMETAETLLLSRLGFLQDVYHRLPRVHVAADFRRPLWFGDRLEVRLSVADVGRTSVSYALTISRDGEVCVEMRAVAVLLDRAGGVPVGWPEPYRHLLLSAGEQAPERLIAG